MNIQGKEYVCKFCGGENFASNEELSTFCAYCGQPIILADRLDSRSPEGIIPFMINREHAELEIKRLINQSIFVPKEFLDIRISDIKGIYIPFWLFDIKCSGKIYLTVPRFVDYPTGFFKDYYREGDCAFKKMPCCATNKLNYKLCQELLPYDMSKLRKFDIEYLSGFYSDMPHYLNLEMIEHMKKFAHELFEQEVRSSVYNKTKEQVHVQKSEIKTDVLEMSQFGFLPAWFFACQYKGETYVLLVNGQTGKTVGAVPVDWKKVIGCFILLGVLLTIVMSFIAPFMLNRLKGTFNPFSSSAVIVIFPMLFFAGIAEIYSYRKKIKSIAKKDLLDYMKSRKEK